MFSDGRRKSNDKTLKVWDVETGECVATLEGHSRARVAASTDWLRRSIALPCFRTGARVVSASDDKTLKVWDVATGECVATLEGHTKTCVAASTVVMIWLRHRVHCVAVSPDGRRASCLGRGDKTLKLWAPERRVVAKEIA